MFYQLSYPCFKSSSEDLNKSDRRSLYTLHIAPGRKVHRDFSVRPNERTTLQSTLKSINGKKLFLYFQFGCLLVECFLKSAHINVNLFNDGPEKILPAFYHTYEFNNDKRFGILKPHPIVCKLFKGYLAKQGEISMETTSVPMLVPPRPWRATKDGAYLILPGVRLVYSSVFTCNCYSHF